MKCRKDNENKKRNCNKKYFKYQIMTMKYLTAEDFISFNFLKAKKHANEFDPLTFLPQCYVTLYRKFGLKTPPSFFI